VLQTNRVPENLCKIHKENGKSGQFHRMKTKIMMQTAGYENVTGKGEHTILRGISYWETNEEALLLADLHKTDIKGREK
jgi:hypothetical protein